MFTAKVYVTLKQSILDPQGSAVEKGLRSLGYGGVEGVRVGKFLEVFLEAADFAEATNQIEEMCHKVLSNPVIEDYRYELTEV